MMKNAPDPAIIIFQIHVPGSRVADTVGVKPDPTLDKKNGYEI